MSAALPPIPFFDLSRQSAMLKVEMHEALDRIIDSGRFVLGPAVERLEASLARRIGARFAVATSSGTDALIAALMAAGVGPGDEVITSPFTFVATGMAIVRLGAVPVYVDVDPRTLNVSPSSIERAITARTRAFLPVHLFGRCLPLGELADLAARRGVAFIEDAAQALGATHDGRAAGSAGLAGCFSFFPTKNLGAYGDGGLVTTSDAQIAEALRVIRAQGQATKYVTTRIGGNFRLDALQAAFLEVKLRYLDEWTARRIHLADRYVRSFDEKGLGHLLLRASPANERHVQHQFVIRSTRRDALRSALSAAGIGSEVYYPLPLHLQATLCPSSAHVARCPEAERASREVLALPIFPELTDDEQARVVDAVCAFELGAS